MQNLGRADLQACLDVVHAIGAASTGGGDFARAGMASLTRLVPSELTTLSVCDLDTGHRSVESDLPNAISKREIEAFDRHFDEHPLVREHGRNGRAETLCMSDVLPPGEFRRSALFDEYYRPIGIDHTMAVPIHRDETVLVSFVFNRSGREFTDRERSLMEMIRPHLGDLYRLSRELGTRPTQWAPPARLTAREQEVLRCVAHGKTDRDIGEILDISPRTVHKHLQRIYEKLGVETRTAAVVRAANLRL